MIEVSFSVWYSALNMLAQKHGESVADKDAWREEYELGKTTEEAFYGEYPEHKPKKKGTRNGK